MSHRLMTRARLSLALVVALLAVHCSRDEPVDFPLDGIRRAELKGSILILDAQLNKPTTAAKVSGRLIVSDNGSDSILRVFADSGSGVYRTAFALRTGEGPGEFRYVTQIHPDTGSRFWAFDPILARLTLVHSDGDQLQSSRRPWDSLVVVESPQGLADPLWLDDSTLVSVSLRHVGGRLAYYNRQGRFVKQAGSFPALTKVPSELNGQVMQGPILMSPDRERILVGTRVAGHLSLYSRAGVTLRSTWGPFRFAPLFHAVRGDKRTGFGPSAAAVAEQRFGYLAFVGFRDRVLSLFSGRRIKDYPKSFAMGQQVHVFDWDLNLECILVLDHPLVSLTMDTAGPSLIGVTYEPEPAVVTYPLPADACAGTTIGERASHGSQ